MTPKRQQELRRKCEAATPAPWEQCHDYEGAEFRVTAIRNGMVSDICHAPFYRAEDAALIAEARTAIPELLDYVARLEGRMREALTHLSRIGPPSHTCAGDPVCAAQTEWPPEQWCDSCLANAERRALED